MSHSTHAGFNVPPICSESGRLFLACVASLAFPDFQSRAVGVAKRLLGEVFPLTTWIRSPLPPRSAMDAVGVGHIRMATTVSKFGKRYGAFATASGVIFAAIAEHDRGVGDDPNPVPAVRGANVGSRYAMPLRIIPERGQVSENVCKPPPKQSCDVFHDDVARSYLANEPSIFAPEAGSFSGQSGTFPGVTKVLTGEPAAYDIGP